jgi:hypothetical protein
LLSVAYTVNLISRYKMAFEDAHMLFASAVLAAQPAFVDVECAPDLLGDTVQYV